MKNITIFALMAALLICGLGRVSAQEKNQDEKRIAQKVQEILDSRSFEIEVDYMMPLRGGAEVLSGTYSVSVKDEKLNSYLPYKGQARSIPYGGGNGLNFEATIDEYTDKGFKKDSREIQIKVQDDGDSYVYVITVYDNGRADIFVQSRNRDDISFRGNLNIPE